MSFDVKYLYRKIRKVLFLILVFLKLIIISNITDVRMSGKVVSLLLICIQYYNYQLFLNYFSSILFLSCGIIEQNSGYKISHWISFFHMKLISICARDFSNVSQLKAMLTSHHYDIICLSETFLYSWIETNNNRIDT